MPLFMTQGTNHTVSHAADICAQCYMARNYSKQNIRQRRAEECKQGGLR